MALAAATAAASKMDRSISRGGLVLLVWRCNVGEVVGVALLCQLLPVAGWLAGWLAGCWCRLAIDCLALRMQYYS